MTVKITNLKDSGGETKSYLVFGNTKTGKTMLATTLPAGKVLLINTENNIDSIEGADINKADCYNVADFTSVLDMVIANGKSDHWVFIDSITDIVQKMFNEIFSKEKDGRQGYQKFELRYIELMDKIKSLPCNVVCIAQQGLVKDETTGGMIAAPVLTWAKLQTNLPYRFSAVLAAKIIKDKDGKDVHVIQCHPCPQYAVGVRTKYGEPNPLGGYEKPNLLDIHNKVIGITKQPTKGD